MSKPRIYTTFLGAAGDEVTGSSTLLKIEINGKTYYGLVDVGVVQGKNENRNFDYPVDSSKIDFVLITHSHADHMLALPLLREYKGKIYGTESAFKQGRELLLDSAYQNENNAAFSYGITSEVYKRMLAELDDLRERANHENLERYNELLAQTEEVQSYALYTKQDVENIVKHFCLIQPYEYIMIKDDIYVRFIPSTHQNGATSIELYVGFGEDAVSIAFSGDIGSSNSILYKNHNYIPNNNIKYYIMECLHGIEKPDQTQEEAYHQLRKIVINAVRENKRVILAGFSLDRNSLMVYLINRMIDEYNLSANVFFDSPLGYRELMHYKNDYAAGNSLWFKNLGRNPFDTNEIIFCNRYMDHMDVVRSIEPEVIITASAMGYGGRIIDYFDHDIQNDNAIFVFLGWLNPECPSSILHNAEIGEIIKINDQHHVKHCKTYQITGFSAHGYFPEIESSIKRYPKINALILNHAERETKKVVMEELKKSYDFEMYSPEINDGEFEQTFYCMTAGSMHEIETMEGYKIFSDVLLVSKIT